MPSQHEPERDLPELVARWNEGDTSAFHRIVELVYDDLRAIASRHLGSERADHTLDTTALVHEAYVAMSERTGPEWRSRPQFFALLSRVMRHVLIDHARRRNAAKRGASKVLVPLDDDSAPVDTQLVELLAVNEVLERLEARDARLARIVECRFFGGMSAQEIGGALGISSRTVERDWRRARAYIATALSTGPAESADGP